ncbi:hypothetical protein IFR05_002151 [Cadophora sp. M221]|nr:hypothetical protein IFR05_002151 [Cadophora sp. M221]
MSLPNNSPGHNPTSSQDETPKLKICIVGAGVSGLYTAMILEFLDIPGLEYEILESSNRVGGRIYTHHFTEEKHQYYDVGAMRYPRIPMTRSYHDGIDGAANTPEYFNDIVHISNVNRPDTNKVSSANGGPVPERNVLKGAVEIMEDVYGPFKKALDENFKEGWKKLMTEDAFSAREVLRRSSKHGDNDTIQWLDTVMCASNTLDQGFTDNLMDNYISSVPTTILNGDRWVCIEGGSEVIIKAMQVQLSITPQLQKRVTAISIDRSADSNLGMLVQVAGEVSTRRYSTVFNTTTLACAQRIDLSGAGLSFAQKEAIRAFKYDTSCKIAMRFKTNWWKKAGIVGGEAVTDLPIRLCVYPPYNIHDDADKPAVLLCSYTWSQDAQRIGSLIGSDGKGKSDELLELCMKNLALLHSNVISEREIREQLMDYHAYDWGADPNMSGGVAMFAPG